MGAKADGVVHCACGNRHWGHAGAAGVLAWKNPADPATILQLRAPWSMSGGTWGIPGGAIDFDESPIEGALREAKEEAGMGPVRVWAATKLHHPDWSYTTIIAQASAGQKAVVTDHESDAMEWASWRDLRGRDLMPAFEQSLPLLDQLLGRSLIVIDKNVLPEGWEEALLRRTTFGFSLDAMTPSRSEKIELALSRSRDGDFPRTITWFPDIVIVGDGPLLKPHAVRGALPATIHYCSQKSDIPIGGYDSITTVGVSLPGSKALDPNRFTTALFSPIADDLTIMTSRGTRQSTD